MVYPSFCVIGTAGRKEDKRHLTMNHYDRMVQGTMRLLEHLDIDTHQLKAYSGGAAWADHVVVSLALLNVVRPENVTLFLPTEIGPDGFFGKDEKSNKTASTCNYYHRMFSDQMVFSSIEQILRIKELGATLDPGTGNFFQRNSSVAQSVTPNGVLLAWTFGSPEFSQQDWTLRSFGPNTRANDAGLKDGGTADTFTKAKCFKWHGRIGKEV